MGAFKLAREAPHARTQDTLGHWRMQRPDNYGFATAAPPDAVFKNLEASEDRLAPLPAVEEQHMDRVSADGFDIVQFPFF